MHWVVLFLFGTQALFGAVSCDDEFAKLLANRALNEIDRPSSSGFSSAFRATYENDAHDNAMVRAANQALMNQNFGEYSTPELVAQVRNGVSAERIVVITHQENNNFDWGVDLFSGTSERLRTDPRFRSIPRVFLASDTYRLDSDLKKQATAVFYSVYGQFDARFNTSEVHLMGGECRGCLANTVQSVVKATVSKSPLSIHLHSDLIYDRAPGPDYESEITLKQYFEKEYWNPNSNEFVLILQKMLDHRSVEDIQQNPNLIYEYRRKESNPASREYQFRNKITGKMVLIKVE